MELPYGLRPFEPFVPLIFGLDPALDAAGQAYLQLPRRLMVMNDEGLAKTYDRFRLNRCAPPPMSPSAPSSPDPTR